MIVWSTSENDKVVEYRIHHDAKKSHTYFVVGPNLGPFDLSLALKVGRLNYKRATSFPKELFACLFYLDMMA